MFADPWARLLVLLAALHVACWVCEGLQWLWRNRRAWVFWTPIPASLALAACGTPNVPPVALNAAPPAPVVAKIAIPAPCVVEQVPMPAYPGELIREDDDIYAAARIAMSDRRVRIAERDRLRAANANPCPSVPKGGLGTSTEKVTQ